MFQYYVLSGYRQLLLMLLLLHRVVVLHVCILFINIVFFLFLCDTFFFTLIVLFILFVSLLLLIIHLHDACMTSTDQRIRVFDHVKVEGYDVSLRETLKDRFLHVVDMLYLTFQNDCCERMVPVGTLSAEHSALLEGLVEASA